MRLSVAPRWSIAPIARLSRVRGAALAVALLAGSLSAADAQSFDGSYVVTTPMGPAVLSLVTLPGGAVEGELLGFGGRDFAVEGLQVEDDDGETSVEGMFIGDGMADFILYPEDSGAYGLLLTPYDANGAPQTSASAVFSAERRTDDAVAQAPSAGRAPAARPPAPSAQPPSGAAVDGRLVGIWSTQVVMNSSVGSVATQMFMQLAADGRLVDLGSRAMGSGAGVGLDSGLEGGGERALWSARDGVLMVSQDGRAWAPLAGYEVTGGRLVLRYVQDGSIQIWARERWSPLGDVRRMSPQEADSRHHPRAAQGPPGAGVGNQPARLATREACRQPVSSRSTAASRPVARTPPVRPEAE